MGKKTSIAELTAKYVGRPFAEYSCMQLVRAWYEDIGVYFPDSFEDLTLDNYMSAWAADREGTINKMLTLFSTLGAQADSLKRHDLLAVEDRTGNIYGAIFLGNGLIINSNIHQGVRVLHLGKLNTVVTARRLLCQE